MARKVFDSAGQALAAQSEMNRQAADGAAKEIKEQTKKAAKHWGDANAAYSEAQTEQTNKTGEFAERTKQHWVNANKSYSEAYNEHAQRIGEQAAEASRKYGEMWALTSGVTGSDQTGASIHGYRNTKGHAVSHEASKQTAETIRKQIADGGIDVLGHAIAARGLSGGKTLDSYNKFLEYSATGEISKDNTVTPGRYTEIVDEEIAKYLSKQYGIKAGEIYTNTTKTFDDGISLVLGNGLSVVKSAIDTAGEALERARLNGANNQQAVTYGFGAGLSDVVGAMTVEAGKGFDFPIKKEITKQLDKLPSNMREPIEEGLSAGAAVFVEDIAKEMLNKGFTKKQADKILRYEMSKIQDYGQEITVGALQSIAKKLLK